MTRLRRRAPSTPPAPVDDLPPTPTLELLQRAALAARGGRAVDCDRYASLLLAVDADPAAAKVEQAAEELLVSADASVWRSLDLAARRSWWRAPAWSKTAQERLASGHAGLLGLVVASFHPSGFVREAAVTRLGESVGPLPPRALAVRAGDWVPQVRDRARASLAQHLTSVDGLLAVGALAEAFAGRVHDRWLAEQFERSTAALDDGELAVLCAAPNWQLRRAAYRIALAGQRLDVEQLVDAAQHDTDMVIRTRCADAAIRVAAATGELSRVRLLVDSGTAAVRASAVAALARAGDTSTALAALPDRNPAVREVAQAAVRHAGGDPVARYRELVRATEPVDPGAVAGLGETGLTADAELVRPVLTHPLPRGRAEAVRALGRLGVVDLDTLLAMLADPAPGVVRQATLTLRTRAGDIPVASIEPLLRAANASHTRAAAYRVLREHDVWTRIRVDLELYDDSDPRLRNRARGDLAGWLYREAATTYSMPPGHIADRLADLLQRLADTMTPDQQRLLRFHLGLAKRNTGS